MPRPPGRPRKRLALIAAVLLFASSIVAVVALGPRTPVVPPGPAPLFTAFTEFELCDTAGPCSVVEVTLASDWHGHEGRICVNATTGPLIERGCSIVPRSFGLDSSAIAWTDLPETVVKLASTECNDRDTCQDIPTRAMTIQGSWAADGATMHSLRSSGTHAPICGLPESMTGAVRTASLSLVVNDEPIRAFGNIRALQYPDVPAEACAGFIP